MKTTTRMSWLLALPLLSGCVTLVMGAMPPPAGLLDRDWQVVTMSGEAPASSASGTLRFGSDGQVTGRGFCNRYFGSYTLENGRLAIGAIASTMMACEDAVMGDERRLFAALGQATALEIVAGGRLVLRSDTETVVEADPGQSR